MGVFHWGQPYNLHYNSSVSLQSQGSGTKIQKKGVKKFGACLKQDLDLTWSLGVFLHDKIGHYKDKPKTPNQQAISGLDKPGWQTNKTGTVSWSTPTGPINSGVRSASQDQTNTI